MRLNEVMNNPDDELGLYKFRFSDFYYFENSKIGSSTITSRSYLSEITFYTVTYLENLRGTKETLVKSFNINELKVLVTLKPKITIEELISYALKQSY